MERVRMPRVGLTNHECMDAGPATQFARQIQSILPRRREQSSRPRCERCERADASLNGVDVGRSNGCSEGKAH